MAAETEAQKGRACNSGADLGTIPYSTWSSLRALRQSLILGLKDCLLNEYTQVASLKNTTNNMLIIRTAWCGVYGNSALHSFSVNLKLF